MTPQEELRLYRAIESGNLSPQQELSAMRALESGEGDVNRILGRGADGRRRAPSFEDLIATTSTRDERNFEYKTGADARLRAQLSFMETPEEKENLLKELVGEAGYTKDPSGLLALTPEGQQARGIEPIEKNLVIEEKGISFADIADIVGIVPETTGSIIGGILGAPGIVTGALGAAGGAAAGQLVEEGIESLLGLQRQTAGQVAMDAATEAALAGSLDLGANLIYRGGKAVISGVGKGANAATKAFGQTERELGREQAQRALAIMDRGGLPSYEAAGMPAAISRASQIAESISGDQKRAVQNVIFALNQKDKLLKQAGISSVDQLAEVIGTATPKKIQGLERALSAAQDAHMKAIDEGISLLTKYTREGAEVSDQVLDTLVKNYDEAMKTSAAQYRAVDNTLSRVRGTIKVNNKPVEVTGGELPIFNIKALKTRYDDVIRSQYGSATAIPPDQFLEIGQQITQLVNRGARRNYTSFNGLKNLRKNVNDALMDPKLSIQDTTARRLLKDMRDIIDNMISPEGKALNIRFAGGPENADIIKSAMDQLKSANKNYREEIKMFERLETLGILRNLGEPGANVKLTAGRLFDRIIESPRRIEAVLNASKGQREEVRRALAKSYMDDALLAANKDFADPTKFNGVQFYGRIKRLGESGKAIFGDDWQQVQNLSRSLAYNGVKRLDDDTLQRIAAQNPTDNIIITLRNIRDAQINLDDAMSSKVLRDLARGAVDPEEAAAAIVSPKITRAQMNRILNFFKDNPVAQERIKQTIINDILGSVDEDVFVSEKAAYSLRNALQAYKPEMLNRVLGEQTVKDLRELSEDLIFLRDTGRRGAGSLAADAIRTGMFTNPMGNLPKVVRFRVVNYLLNNPDVMRRALEVKAGRQTPQAAAQSLSQILNEAAAQVTGEGVPMTTRLAGAATGIGNVIGALNRGNIALRQAGTQAVLEPQSARGERPLAPPQAATSVPQITSGAGPIISYAPGVNPVEQFSAQQASLRERARQNPYIAASLLGGLGSAALLNR